MRTLLICIIVALLSIISNAQSQTDNWFFGEESGLIFDPSKVSIANNSQIQAPAGCTAFSDVNRQLLFYTNGETVWNKDHEIMENGSDLSGEVSNTQSSLIIPKPNSTTNYYLFTTRNSNSDKHVAGLRYSEIEISSNFPLGKVIHKNVPLDSFFTEKITAIYSEDGNKIYVLSFGSKNNESESPYDTFSTYTVDLNGVSRRTTLEVPEALSESSKGMIKASPDGKTIALAIYDFNEKEAIYLFDFDRANGAIKYRKKLSMNVGVGAWSIPYGLEFSQNSKILYYSSQLNVGSSLLRQINIEGGSTENSEPVSLASSNTENYRSLQLASNGKIYLSKTLKGDEEGNTNTLAVINFPEVLGTGCAYQDSENNLIPLSISSGLPNFIPNLFKSKIFTENQCFIDSFSFSTESYVDITNVEWDFGDGNSANGIDVNYTYAAPGNYSVEALLTLSNNTQTRIYKKIEAFALPVLSNSQQLIECDEDFDGLSTFNLNSIKPKITNISLNETLIFYLSQDDLNNDIPITNSENFQNTVPNQEIFVKVINENGCFETTSFTVSARFVSLGAINDFFTCENSNGINGDGNGQFRSNTLRDAIRDQLGLPRTTTLSFYPSFIDAQTNLNEFEEALVTKTGTIFVKAQEVDFSCGGIQSFNVIVNAEVKINLEETYKICFNPNVNPPVIISAEASNNRYEWRNSQGTVLSIAENFTLDTLGEFSLTVYKSENGLLCSNSKTFVVENPEKATFSAIEVNTEDETNNIVNVTIDGNSTYEFSLDNVNFFGNATSFTFNNVEAGLRTIYVKDINNCEEAIFTSVSVIGFKKFFTPNDDGKNDYWNINGLDQTSFRSINVRIFDRFGKLIHQITNFSSLGWDGTYNNQKLLANNYWFKADIIDKDNNVISESGNFSLIRN